MTKINVIVQARMGSTRFPGKVMADLDGKPMIGHLLDELKKCKRVDDIIWAVASRSRKLISYLGEQDQKIILGPEHNVAERFRLAILRFPCDYFIRVCADSPLIDAWMIDEMCGEVGRNSVVEYNKQDFLRYGSPQLVNTQDFLKALPFFDDYDREHVTTFFTRRLVVDTPEDLDYVRRWIEFSKLLS